MPAPIRIGNFKGRRPGTGARILPEGYAQEARDCRLTDGEIDPIGGVTDVETITRVLDHRAITADGYESTHQYIKNRNFSRQSLFWLTGGGWLIIADKAKHEPGLAGALAQGLDRDDVQPRIRKGLGYTLDFTISAFIGGTLTPKIGGAEGTAVFSNGTFSQNITSGIENKLIEFEADSSGDFKLDDISLSVNLSAFGAAETASPAWIRLHWEASDNLDEYNDYVVKLVGGTGSGQEKTITNYFGDVNGKFHVAEVDSDWSVVPDETTVYELYRIVTAEEVESLHLFNQGGEFDFTAAVDNLINIEEHEFKNGDIVIPSTTDTLPAGLVVGTPYWVLDKTPDTFKVSASFEGAIVDITDTGTGTHTMSRGLWFRWGSDVDVVRTPVAGDINELTIWTGQGFPKISFKEFADDDPAGSFGTVGYPLQSFTLGVPDPVIDENDDVGGVGGSPGDDFLLTYESNADNADLFADLQSVGWDGITRKNFIVKVNPGVQIGSSASGNGMTITSAWPKGTMITFTNCGIMNGGHGAGGAINTGTGGTGGDAWNINPLFHAALGVVTTDFAVDDKIDLTAHGLTTGMSVSFSNSGGALPGGLLPDTRYFVINESPNDFEVSLTKGGSAVNITDDGTGTHSVHDVTLFLINAVGAEIYAPGGGGGGGGVSFGCDILIKFVTCVACCTANGGVGGKGFGNDANASGSVGVTCGAQASASGGTGGTGGVKATAGASGANGESPVASPSCLTGGGFGGTGGSAGVAIDGVSLISVTDNGTITGSQIN